MNRRFNLSVPRVVVVVLVLVLPGSTFAASHERRETWKQGRGRGRENGIVKMVKKIVRALGDGLTIPKP